MADVNNAILAKMLDRLLAGLVNGPNLNCRPHNSRQRIDLMQLAKLQDLAPHEIIEQLLGPKRSVRISAKALLPKGSTHLPEVKTAISDDELDALEPVINSDDSEESSAAEDAPAESTETVKSTARSSGGRAKKSDAKPDAQAAAESAQLRAYQAQQTVLAKIRSLIDDAKTYEQDTGVPVLNLGFPVLSLPPGASSNGQFSSAGRRILAPLAFIPITIKVTGGGKPGVELACRYEGEDTVLPNHALLAWLERQTGQTLQELFADAEGEAPWREVHDIVSRVAELLDLSLPAPFALPADQCPGKNWLLSAAPRSEDDGQGAQLMTSAVVGLFPADNQGLIRDTQAMVQGTGVQGPVESFVRAGVSFESFSEETLRYEAWEGGPRRRVVEEERAISPCDPCQARAVRLARTQAGLVIHGPPGTGKSQTITNIIGDHLARGERVLMVCDKRTALDVVAHRLDRLGLGHLCALIHDPQRDQRDLYRQVREQLENLTEMRGHPQAKSQLAKIDTEIEAVYFQLRKVWDMLMLPVAPGRESFHQLVGQWLDLPEVELAGVTGQTLSGSDLVPYDQVERGLSELASRAERIGLHQNPWAQATSVTLNDFLGRSMQKIRSDLQQCLAASHAVDATNLEGLPPFEAGSPLTTQAEARVKLATLLEEVLQQTHVEVRVAWTEFDTLVIQRMSQGWAATAAEAEVFRRSPLDPELKLQDARQVVSLTKLNHQLQVLRDYIHTASLWYGFLFFGKRKRAFEILGAYFLPKDLAGAKRLTTYLEGVRARLLLTQQTLEWTKQTLPPGELLDDQQLDQALKQYPKLLELLGCVETSTGLQSLKPAVHAALREAGAAADLLNGLRRSPERASAIEKLEQSLQATGLITSSWIREFSQQLAAGEQASATLLQLQDRVETVEDVLRIRDEISILPKGLRPWVQAALGSGLSAAESLAVVKKQVLYSEILRRLEAQPELKNLDTHRLQESFAQHMQLETQKREQVTRLIRHLWLGRQKERLLATTGSRLNSAGTALRQRFIMRGERAVRLRQAIALGLEVEGGDPLFDLRPIWMASPETVAQIFPLRQMFDVVIFDEASQCRLEEALPVLTRAKRVVVAGDPKQLPPTRFFESAMISSDQDDIENETQLFETVQSEIEDLLSAGLSLQMQQSYLDVHYRSNNADLIEFSNQQFYGSRLQPIPAHPANRQEQSPILLYNVNGVYRDRSNEIEAEKVAELVSQLLEQPQPPSIGIACFNLQQRTVILEKLHELAERNEKFAGRLGEARSRQGTGSFEGLFVKNLENVQGDERDHIIISTTYGPDEQGRFYRRFGPLARSGGGRRLNVLVTRARQKVHVLTSIPSSEYRNLPPLPAGQTATGSWLLYAYIQFAEQLQQAYVQASQQQKPADQESAQVVEFPTHYPSTFAQALAKDLWQSNHVGSYVHWGNDGFCVDLTLRKPSDPQAVTIGVLCDGTRFAKADDPVEWELFRTSILQNNGWQLQRVWTPQFFRDPAGTRKNLLAQAEAYSNK